MTEQAQVQTVKLELTVEEVNAILASLGKHPFESIFQLIGKIQSQGNAQLQAAAPAPAAAPAAV